MARDHKSALQSPGVAHRRRLLLFDPFDLGLHVQRLAEIERFAGTYQPRPSPFSPGSGGVRGLWPLRPRISPGTRIVTRTFAFVVAVGKVRVTFGLVCFVAVQGFMALCLQSRLLDSSIHDSPRLRLVQNGLSARRFSLSLQAPLLAGVVNERHHNAAHAQVVRDAQFVLVQDGVRRRSERRGWNPHARLRVQREIRNEAERAVAHGALFRGGVPAAVNFQPKELAAPLREPHHRVAHPQFFTWKGLLLRREGSEALPQRLAGHHGVDHTDKLVDRYAPLLQAPVGAVLGQ